MSRRSGRCGSSCSTTSRWPPPNCPSTTCGLAGARTPGRSPPSPTCAARCSTSAAARSASPAISWAAAASSSGSTPSAASASGRSRSPRGSASPSPSATAPSIASFRHVARPHAPPGTGSVGARHPPARDSMNIWFGQADDCGRATPVASGAQAARIRGRCQSATARPGRPAAPPPTSRPAMPEGGTDLYHVVHLGRPLVSESLNQTGLPERRRPLRRKRVPRAAELGRLARPEGRARPRRRTRATPRDGRATRPPAGPPRSRPGRRGPGPASGSSSTLAIRSRQPGSESHRACGGSKATLSRRARIAREPDPRTASRRIRLVTPSRHRNEGGSEKAYSATRRSRKGNLTSRECAMLLRSA